MVSAFQDYVGSLYSATNFEQAFSVYDNEVQRLGFDGALYTYIPKVLLDSGFSVQPVYEVSDTFSRRYLAHYAEARFDKHDPMIKAVEDGVSQPIDWWGGVSECYKQSSRHSRTVIDETRSYGIQNGLTIPLMSGRLGISGASIISHEGERFTRLLDEQIDQLQLVTRLFHSLVMSNVNYLGGFSRPLLEVLNERERGYLTYLAEGRQAGEIAALLNTTPKYLEQLMLKIRRKLSGVSPDDSPKINRNQVLYYAGLMNILEHNSI